MQTLQQLLGFHNTGGSIRRMNPAEPGCDASRVTGQSRKQGWDRCQRMGRLPFRLCCAGFYWKPLLAPNGQSSADPLACSLIEFTLESSRRGCFSGSRARQPNNTKLNQRDRDSSQPTADHAKDGPSIHSPKSSKPPLDQCLEEWIVAQGCEVGIV